MPAKPAGSEFVIKEQIIEDEGVSGLTLMFERTPYGGRRTIFGDLPFGNREFIFDLIGLLGVAGTSVHACRRPSRLAYVSPDA